MQTRDRSKSKQLADWLDNRFILPGTNIRFGIDPLIGLVPGLGDWLGGVISIYFLVYAAMLGGKATILIRMFMNIVADLLIGSIPLLGDIFDVAWKANLRNAELLQQLEKNPEALAAESRWILWTLLVFFVLIITGLLIMIAWMAGELLDLLF